MPQMPHPSQLLSLLLGWDALTRPHLVTGGLFWAQNSARILQKDYTFPWIPTRKNNCPLSDLQPSFFRENPSSQVDKYPPCFPSGGEALFPHLQSEVSSGFHLAPSSGSPMAQGAPHVLGCHSSPSVTTCPKEALPPLYIQKQKPAMAWTRRCKS